uniref:Uncharacterized protein n=1 Tax=Schistosoma haematobium TaxID=6185 RepID=A0A095CG26_SCHHA
MRIRREKEVRSVKKENNSKEIGALTTFLPFPTSPRVTNNARRRILWDDIRRTCSNHRSRCFKMVTPIELSSLCPNTRCWTSSLLTWCCRWMSTILRRQR